LNPLIVNSGDIFGGAALATYRLHQGLKEIGINSLMLVQNKGSADPSVLGPKSALGKATALVRPYLDLLPTKLSMKGGNVFFSPAAVPGFFGSHVQKISPDLVHLFFLNFGFVRLEDLKKINKPIVWTLHDMWPFTGGCHYDGECGRYRQSCGSCPLLNSSREHDLSRWVWKRKKKAWRDIDITVVATSKWLADCARSSSLFGQYRIEVLPNCFDEIKYKPLDKIVARRAYGLPLDKKLILFSAVNARTDKRKGFQFLRSALNKISCDGWGSQAELVVLGASQPDDSLDLGMKAHYMGRLYDEISQVLLYSACDVLVAPSMQENLSNTVLESLACGLPVVAFNIGGMPDLIKHEFNGYLAEAFSPDDLACGITWILEKDSRFKLLSENARNDALKRYMMKNVAGRYKELYQDILK
jgi:glycosyltransferase involved in cell wall biosynthesis